MKTHLGWEQYHCPEGAAKLKPAELGYNHASQLHQQAFVDKFILFQILLAEP